MRVVLVHQVAMPTAAVRWALRVRAVLQGRLALRVRAVLQGRLALRARRAPPAPWALQERGALPARQGRRLVAAARAAAVAVHRRVRAVLVGLHEAARAERRRL